MSSGAPQPTRYTAKGMCTSAKPNRTRAGSTATLFRQWAHWNGRVGGVKRTLTKPGNRPQCGHLPGRVAWTGSDGRARPTQRTAAVGTAPSSSPKNHAFAPGPAPAWTGNSPSIHRGNARLVEPPATAITNFLRSKSNCPESRVAPFMTQNSSGDWNKPTQNSGFVSTFHPADRTQQMLPPRESPQPPNASTSS